LKHDRPSETIDLLLAAAARAAYRSSTFLERTNVDEVKVSFNLISKPAFL